MSALRLGLMVIVALSAVAAVAIWRLLGRLVVAYARMEAEERAEDNAPPPRAPSR